MTFYNKESVLTLYTSYIQMIENIREFFLNIYGPLAWEHFKVRKELGGIDKPYAGRGQNMIEFHPVNYDVGELGECVVWAAYAEPGIYFRKAEYIDSYGSREEYGDEVFMPLSFLYDPFTLEELEEVVTGLQLKLARRKEEKIAEQRQKEQQKEQEQAALTESNERSLLVTLLQKYGVPNESS